MEINSSFGLSLSFLNTHGDLSMNATSLLPPANPSPPLTAASVWSRSALTRDVPKRWRGAVPNRSQKTAENLLFFYLWGAFNNSSFSLMTTPSYPRLTVLITANPSPRWTATHLWLLQTVAQIQSKHTRFCIPTACTYLAVSLPSCLQWKDWTFTPSSPACAAARCCPRHYFSMAQACYCTETYIPLPPRKTQLPGT